MFYWKSDNSISTIYNVCKTLDHFWTGSSTPPKNLSSSLSFASFSNWKNPVNATGCYTHKCTYVNQTKQSDYATRHFSVRRPKNAYLIDECI